MEAILAIASPYLPVLASFAVTHGLAWLKLWVNKDHPLIWWLVSFMGNAIVAGGGSVALGADEAQAALVGAIGIGVSQGYHAYLKQKVKKGLLIKPVAEAKPVE